MTGIIDITFQSFFSNWMEWYDSFFLQGLTNAPRTIYSFIMSYLAIQFFFYVIPPFKKLMMALGAPFRYIHVWLHVDTAKSIEFNKYGIAEKTPNLAGLWGDNGNNDLAPLLHTFFDTKDALRIASAPLKGAIALLFFLFLSSPILASLGIFGTVIHIYFLFCCFGIAFPSIADYSFLMKGKTAKPMEISPGYVLWSYFIFSISGFIALKQTGSGTEAIMSGLIYTMIYLGALMLIAKIKNK
ncbi:MAG: hypothetical protein ACFFG0_21550 [Candidatus Thorarchaeota archaeon]